MERKTPKTRSAKATPKRTPRAKATTGATATPVSKTGAKANADAAATRRANVRDAKAKTAAKATPKTAATTGPTPKRIELAITVAKLRKLGAKWSEIATETGVAEPTLAKLRKDVRAGVFANVSPVAKRTPADAF